MMIDKGNEHPEERVPIYKPKRRKKEITISSWEDTVMSREDAGAMFRFKDFKLALMAQAKISFKRGYNQALKKVVEDIERIYVDVIIKKRVDLLEKLLYEWQSWLKEGL